MGINEVNKIILKAIGMYIDSVNTSYAQCNYAYYHFLRKTSIFENYEFTDKIAIYNFKDLKGKLPLYVEKYQSHFETNSSLLAERLKNGFFKNALQKLKIIDHEIFNVSTFLIKIILLNKIALPIDDTTKETVGFSCIDFKDHFDDYDFIELIIHQMTHMILFMDDYSNMHIFEDDRDIMIDVGLNYNLGGTQFPLYNAFHSYLIDLEILNFRQQVYGLNFTGSCHGNTANIVSRCEKFQMALNNHVSLFSAHARAILEKAFECFSRIKMEYSATIS